MLKFRGRTNIDEVLAHKLAAAATKAEHKLAVQVASDTSPYVPALTGSLDERTYVDGDQIIYPGPYARYLYYGKVMVDSKTGKGPARFFDKMGNEIIAFPKGSKLTETNKNLVFSKAMHSRAQAHWFEASKAQNINKWVRVAAKEMDKNMK